MKSKHNGLAVIMAGGKGTRLKPYTTFIPKPLMPIADMPIIEVIIQQLKQYGFSEIIVCVGHMAQLIEAFLGDGSRFGLNITYLAEAQPLGTAGPLSGLGSKLTGHDFVLSMNGDVLTTLDYGKAIQKHFESQSAATICVNKRHVDIDFGVLRSDDEKILVGYDEKPTLKYDVSMGINIFDPKALEYIPKNEFYNIPELMMSLVKAGEKVYCYDGDSYWLDIGRIEDYAMACEIFETRRGEFLKA